MLFPTGAMLHLRITFMNKKINFIAETNIYASENNNVVMGKLLLVFASTVILGSGPPRDV
jgi:hypothetical protein